MSYLTNAIISTLFDVLIVTIITLILNYILIKDFRTLINKIKKIAYSSKSNKATLIKQEISKYFFD